MKTSLMCCVAFLFLALPTSAQEMPFSDLALKRMQLRGVPVYIDINADAVPHGSINAQQIQADVELRLRKAGVKIQPKGEYPSYPQLIVKLESMRANDNLFAFSIAVEVFDFVPLDCATKPIAPVITWKVSTMGVAGSNQARFIRDTIDDHVDQFINAYLAAISK